MQLFEKYELLMLINYDNFELFVGPSGISRYGEFVELLEDTNSPEIKELILYAIRHHFNAQQFQKIEEFTLTTGKSPTLIDIQSIDDPSWGVEQDTRSLVISVLEEVRCKKVDTPKITHSKELEKLAVSFGYRLISARGSHRKYYNSETKETRIIPLGARSGTLMAVVAQLLGRDSRTRERELMW